VLHAFTGGADGNYPGSETLLDGLGNIYGIAYIGGNNCTSQAVTAGWGCGTIWKIDKSGKFSVLVTFTGANGAAPYHLVLYKNRLYGTTDGGGANDQGVLYSLDTNGKQFTLLHDFVGPDGCQPGRPAFDAAGDVIDRANCGANNTGELFKITPDGAFSVIYTAGAKGPVPQRPIVDKNGLIYVIFNDLTCADPQVACGYIASLATDGTRLTRLAGFRGTIVGYGPYITLDRDIGGVIYGAPVCCTSGEGGADNSGSFFRYTIATNKLEVLHAFNPATDGAEASLPVYGAGRVFYGMTRLGATGSSNVGGIYSVTASGAFSLLYAFAAGNQLATGAYPQGYPIWDNATSTVYGGAAGSGPGSDGQGTCIQPDGQAFYYGCGTVFSYKP
jgi:uncharacterized repeat protein (TIGR03803 family)